MGPDCRLTADDVSSQLLFAASHQLTARTTLRLPAAAVWMALLSVMFLLLPEVRLGWPIARSQPVPAAASHV